MNYNTKEYSFGIELEYFVKNELEEIVPAYGIAPYTDDDNYIGEIRTPVFNNILDCVFHLKKEIFSVKEKLKSQDYVMDLTPEHVITLPKKIQQSNKGVKQSNNIYHSNDHSNKDNSENIYSFYERNLLNGIKTASLQLSISCAQHIRSVDILTDTQTTQTQIKYFDYINWIRLLDKNFFNEIKEFKRIPGEYRIKSGEKSDRIEYRSLPNNIELDKLIKVITTISADN